MSPDDQAGPGTHPSSPESDRGHLPPPLFAHLRALTDRLGVWEHAKFSEPRVEHGFCTDDNARALVVVSRQPQSGADLVDLSGIYLKFVLAARISSGHFHNRREAGGGWIDEVGSDDCQGRAWWALGTVAHRGPGAAMRAAGADAFATCASFGSQHLRANAYASLGAFEMLQADPRHSGAARLIEQSSGVIASAARSRIPWPEIRLSYDNARLPEALLGAGAAMSDAKLTAIGIRLLEWLVGVETNGDHFSFAPDHGWAPGEPRPGFDQQPIEAWAMADACYRAWIITGDPVWKARVLDAARWLLGHNDTHLNLYDRITGGTCDGLMEHSVNQNRGAESTLAGLGALQAAARCESESPADATR